MSGRAIGLSGCFMAGVRVAGPLTYILAHTKNGKAINSRAIIPVYKNSHKGTDAKTGEKGRRDAFKLVAWGKLADVCCRSLPKGKALDCMCDPQSYEGKLFNIDGSVRVDHTGQPITTTKVSFTILQIVFGEESSKQVAEEIQTGRRPVNWNVTSHPDYDLWTSMLVAKQALVWDGRSQMFGYARVVVPQGPGIQVNFAAPAAPGYNAGTAPVFNPVNPASFTGPVYGAPVMGTPAAEPRYVRDAAGNFILETLPGMVSYAANTRAPIAPVVTPGPSIASGQHLF